MNKECRVEPGNIWAAAGAESGPPSEAWGLPLVSGSLLAPQLSPPPQGPVLPRLGDPIPRPHLPTHRTEMVLQASPLLPLDQQALSQRTKGLGPGDLINASGGVGGAHSLPDSLSTPPTPTQETWSRSKWKVSLAWPPNPQHTLWGLTRPW